MTLPPTFIRIQKYTNPRSGIQVVQMRQVRARIEVKRWCRGLRAACACGYPAFDRSVMRIYPCFQHLIGPSCEYTRASSI
eukprot:1175938-Prorocentrum_minimum.AAC.1